MVWEAEAAFLMTRPVPPHWLAFAWRGSKRDLRERGSQGVECEGWVGAARVGVRRVERARQRERIDRSVPDAWWGDIMKGVVLRDNEGRVLWLAKIQKRREAQKGVTVQVRSDEQRKQKNQRYGVGTVPFMNGWGGSTAYAKMLWGYWHTQTAWFGIE